MTIEKIKKQEINLMNLVFEIYSMRNIRKDVNKKKLPKTKNLKLVNWYETKYSLGGQRDVEFLEYFYKRKEIKGIIENIDIKKLFLNDVKIFYFIIDQFINITFSNEKPENLPNKVSKYLIEYLNLKDLGSLKKAIRDKKNEVNRYINEILKNFEDVIKP